MNLRFNRIFLEESSETVQAQSVETQEEEKAEEQTEEIKEVAKTEEPKAEPKVEEQPKKKSTKKVVAKAEEVIPETKEALKPKLAALSAEQENLVLKQALSTGFNAEILTALVIQEVANGADVFENLDKLVEGYMEKYPQMLSQKPKATKPIAPSQEDDSALKERQQRMKYFGGGASDFWQGSGVRNSQGN